MIVHTTNSKVEKYTYKYFKAKIDDIYQLISADTEMHCNSNFVFILSIKIWKL